MSGNKFESFGFGSMMENPWAEETADGQSTEPLADEEPVWQPGDDRRDSREEKKRAEREEEEKLKGVKTGYQNYLNAAQNYDRNLSRQEELRKKVETLDKDLKQAEESIKELDQGINSFEKKAEGIREQAEERTNKESCSRAVRQREEKQRAYQQNQESLNTQMRQNREELQEQNRQLASMEAMLQSLNSGQYHPHVKVAGTDAVGVLNFQTFLKELYGKKQMPKQLLQYLKTPASAIAPSVAGFQQLQEQERRFGASKEAQTLYQSGVGKRDVLILTIQIYSLLAILTSLRSIGIGLFLLLSDPAGALDSFFLPVVYELLFGNLLLGFLVTRDRVFGFLEGIVKHLGFMRKRAYCRILQYDINLDTAKLPIYCYVHHDELAACLKEPQRELYLKSLNESMQKAQRRIKDLEDQKIRLEQKQDWLNREAKQPAQDNRNPSAAGRRVAPEYTRQESMDIRKYREQIEKLEGDKKDILQGLPRKRDEVERRKQEREEIEETVRKSVKAFRAWNGEPPFDEYNPVFQKFIVTEYHDGAVILKHDRQSVEILYETSSGNKPGIVVENVVRELVSSFSKMNPPELLNFHIIDPEGNGDNFMNNIWFLKYGIGRGSATEGKEDSDRKKCGIHVCGNDKAEKLKEYLTDQKNEISRKANPEVLKKMEEMGLSSIDIDALNRILVPESDGKTKTKPIAYQILIYIVPREDSVGALGNHEAFLRLTEENVASSGILPIYLVNRNSVDKRCREYLKKCRVRYCVDPVTLRFEKEEEQA